MSSKIQEKEVEKLNKKKCFIITPIGDENSSIRRHIDGVINSAIDPVLKKFNYELKVSHQSVNSGSIKGEIIRDIYEADLVIANLTYQNPNVMYEVAIRHCAGKPIIHIAEDINLIPFDINDHRTFPYVNDMEGVRTLKEVLSEVIEDIESNLGKISNPIIDNIGKTIITEPPEVSTSYESVLTEMFDIVKSMNRRMDSIEIKNRNNYNNELIPILTYSESNGLKKGSIGKIDLTKNKGNNPETSIIQDSITIKSS